MQIGSSRQQHEESLRVARAELQVVTDNMPAAVAHCDAAHRYVWVSQDYARMLGRTAAEIAGKSIQEVIGQSVYEMILPHINLVLSGQRVEYEALLDFPERGPRWISATYAPICGETGTADGWVALVTDVTHRKDLERALREADSRKDEFLALLAHELRNPLTPICNSLHILRLSDDLSPSVARVREMMERQVDHLVRLLDDLLEVSRITRGQIELRRETVELAAIVRSAVESSQPLIEAAGHQLAITLPAEPVTLEADPGRLAQVIGNLLDNAAKFTSPGGQIWLSARDEDGMAVISVRDTGIGIRPDMLQRVFELFGQADRTVNRTQGGLGIGLALARKLVELHEGSIDAFSGGQDMGSEFVVRIPLATSAHAIRRHMPLTGGSSPAQPRHILVVDDTPAAAYILGKLLEKMGHQVRAISDATSVLDYVRAEHPDTIISDISMPGIDGYELARSLRSEPEFRGIVLVALTGYGQQDDRQRAMDAGFDFHLVKPVSLEALQELIGALPAPATAIPS